MPNDGHLGLFNHNAMSQISFDKTTMSGMPGNPMIDTKNINKPQLRRKLYKFTIQPLEKVGHLGF